MEAISKITDIGQIPSDWNIKTIEQLFENGFQNGVFFEVDRKGKGIPIVNVSDLYGSVPIDGKKLEKFNATEKEIERFIVHKGDLFFTRSSVVPAGIAMCNVYDDKDENGAVFDSHVIKLSVNQQEVNSLFLCLQCRMPYCRSFFIANSKTAIMTTIDQKSLAKCPIPMPQLSEQDDIVGTIRRFDTYIDDLAELIEKKRGIRDGALEELVRGTFTIDGQELIWNESELNEVAFYGKGRATSEKNKYVSTENMNQNFTGLEPYKGFDAITGCQFEKTDTLMANIRPYLKKIWFANFSGCCSADVLVIRAKEGMDSRLLYYFLANERFVNYVMSGGVKGIKMPRGDKEYIMHYPVRVPVDKSEQAIIANSLAAMDEEIEALEIERDKMIQIREGAMDDLLTGRIRLTM